MDLADIWDYTKKEWGEDRADQYLDGLRDRMIWLAAHPSLWKQRGDLAEGVFNYPEASHSIFFRKTAKGIEVARILHHRMDALGHVSLDPRKGKKMKVVGDGFLNTTLPNLSETAPQANQAQYALLLEQIKFGENFKHDLKIDGQETPEERQKIIALIAFIRLLEVVQSLAILAAYGVKEDLLSLFRVFLDAYFVLANCCSDIEFIPLYFQSDERARLKLMNAASKHDTKMFKRLNKAATAEIMSDLKSKIEEERIQPFQSFEYAKKVGCEEIYDSMYRIASSSIHTTPRCLGHYVQADEDGIIIRINHGVDPEKIDTVINGVSSFFIKSMLGLSELFGLDKEEVFQDFEERLDKTAHQ